MDKTLQITLQDDIHNVMATIQHLCLKILTDITVYSNSCGYQ